ncbi:tRNA-uridine aminocarboxypropyltransferase [Polyangium aurulentum]|uniref:tRNA-uridine aminocarboxypropyltransferase n=1 Tax=Polyangium aurulentum TaxID=2567896 RepID=UPI00146F6D4B|nr:tRNA-uridine aminocarboxypropyltransferase [Polyangium aurulentum]UQA56761.1 DTW domain-containing protein [Polyangium aurulentum]
MTLPPGASPRAVCARCRRPASVCYCQHIRPIETATRVVILQHPRERDMPVGTAHMASLCLPRAEVHVGVHWSGSSVLSRALSDPERPAVLLYPGPGAIDVMRDPPSSPVTLIVVDGTWSQARKMVRENPELRALPRYAFTPPRPSEYRIRKEPDRAFVSTIEALVHVLGALEGDPGRCEEMLLPFRAMVEAQIAHAEGLRRGRKRVARAPRRPRSRVPAVVGARAEDLVCVVAEANAWPYDGAKRDVVWPDELVHWMAHRVATGETFEFVLAPRNPLSPTTSGHLGLPADLLLSGGALPSFLEGWRAFSRDTDVLCSWGNFAVEMLASVEGALPSTRIDIREAARRASGGKVGTAEAYGARLGVSEPSPLGRGRAGGRLARLVEITRRLSAMARAELRDR